MDIFNGPPKNGKLQIELAVTIYLGEPFGKATCNLEGNGPLALSAYEENAKLKAVVSTQSFLNTNAIATKLSLNVSAHEQQLINYATG